MTIRDRLEQHKIDIINLYNSGLSLSAVGKKYGCYGSSIQDVFKEWKIPTRKSTNIRSLSDYKDEIHRYFLEGKSALEISKILKFSNQCVGKFMHKNGWSTSDKSCQRKDPLINHFDEILELYNSGMSAIDISRKYSAGLSSVWRMLNKHGIETRDATKYTVDESYFEKIDKWEKAYILGWMYSDGNVSKEVDRWRIQLQEQDGDIIRWICQQVKYSGKIDRRSPAKPNHKWKIAFNICRSKMAKDLVKLGCVPKKSLILDFPTTEQVPDEFLPDFLRGMVDGDGTIKKKKGVINVYLCSTNQFILKMLEKLNITKYKLYKKKDYKTTRILMLTGQTALDFVKYIQNRPCFSLERKRVDLSKYPD